MLDVDRLRVWTGRTGNTWNREEWLCCTFAEARAPSGKLLASTPLGLLFQSSNKWPEARESCTPSRPTTLLLPSPHIATCADGCANPLQTVWHCSACRDHLSLLNEQLDVCGSFFLHREKLLLPSDGNVYLPWGKVLFFRGNVCWCSPPLVGASVCA